MQKSQRDVAMKRDRSAVGDYRSRSRDRGSANMGLSRRVGMSPPVKFSRRHDRKRSTSPHPQSHSRHPQSFRERDYLREERPRIRHERDDRDRDRDNHHRSQRYRNEDEFLHPYRSSSIGWDRDRERDRARERELGRQRERGREGEGGNEKERTKDRDRTRGRDREREQDREREREKERERERERAPDWERGGREHDRGRGFEPSLDNPGERDSRRDRHPERERHREREKERVRERGRGREREREREYDESADRSHHHSFPERPKEKLYERELFPDKTRPINKGNLVDLDSRRSEQGHPRSVSPPPRKRRRGPRRPRRRAQDTSPHSPLRSEDFESLARDQSHSPTQSQSADRPSVSCDRSPSPAEADPSHRARSSHHLSRQDSHHESHLEQISPVEDLSPGHIGADNFSNVSRRADLPGYHDPHSSHESHDARNKQSPPPVASASSHHGSPTSISSGRGSRGAHPLSHSSPNTQRPSYSQSGSLARSGHSGISGALSSHVRQGSPPGHLPSGPGRGFSRGAFKGGSLNSPRGGSRGGGYGGSTSFNFPIGPSSVRHYSNISVDFTSQNGTQHSKSHQANSSSNRNDDTNDKNPRQSQENTSNSELAEKASDTPGPPSRPPPSGPASNSSGSKFSFAFKASSKATATVPKLEISQKFSAPPSRREEPRPEPQLEPHVVDDRTHWERELPRSTPTEPSSSRSRIDFRPSRPPPLPESHRYSRDYRDARDARDYRDPRDSRDLREPRDSRDLRDPRQYRDPRDPRDPRELRDWRDYREPRDARDYRDPREPRDPRETREPREPREHREPRDSRDPRGSREFRERERKDPPPIRKVKIIKKRLKPKPQIPAELSGSRSVYFRKSGNESVVGSGTYGKVYKGVHVYTGRLVALKKIRMEGERDGFPVTAVREIKLLQSLKHQNIVNLQEVMVEDNDCYMVFEYLSHDLTGLLNHPSFKLDPPQRKHLAKQLFEGLDYLHTRGVLHRDIKAANILVSSDGILKLADFGLARFYNKHRQLDYTNRVITIWYRSPELLLGETRYTAAVDVWSAACVMVEIFTRHAIFPGDGTEINQLEKIYAVLGTPNKVEWPDLVQMEWFELLRPGYRRPNHFTEKYRDKVPPAAFLLLKSMFQYDPAKRPSAAEVLAHPYFTQEMPPPRQAIELANIKGDWHEFESKALRREKEKKDRDARKAQELAQKEKDKEKDKEKKRPVSSQGPPQQQREPKRPHVERRPSGVKPVDVQ